MQVRRGQRSTHEQKRDRAGQWSTGGQSRVPAAGRLRSGTPREALRKALPGQLLQPRSLLSPEQRELRRNAAGTCRSNAKDTKAEAGARHLFVLGRQGLAADLLGLVVVLLGRLRVRLHVSAVETAREGEALSDKPRAQPAALPPAQQCTRLQERSEEGHWSWRGPTLPPSRLPRTAALGRAALGAAKGQSVLPSETSNLYSALRA